VAAPRRLIPDQREALSPKSILTRTVALFERVYALFPRLAERRKQLAGTLSGGASGRQAR
jgi:ABC-type branched-subunit amino acid transport system ATPase component